jgi:predicted nucleic acid-binding protein
LPASGTTVAIVDAGPLCAAVDPDDADHAACVATLSRPDLRLVIPMLAVAEATCLVKDRFGALAEQSFIAELADFEVEGPTQEDLKRMGELVEKRRGFRLGWTDASIVALGERLNASIVVTLDRRHFAAVKPRHRKAFELLP